ncbi:MAG: hypothetical protein ACYC21_13210 [Eubacteriales bacterium]
MVKSICSHDFDDICRALDQLSHDTEKMAGKAFEGLLKHNRKTLEEADRLGEKVEQESKQLTQMVISAKEEPKLLSSTTIVEVSNELQKIRYSVDKMIGSIRSKIDEGVLFSDKAVSELKDIFATVLDGLRNIHDLILTKNPVLVNHIVQKSELYDEVARKYAEEHQDRLIKGICLPKSSLIYLLILESLKDILWYINSIALAFKEKD